MCLSFDVLRFYHLASFRILDFEMLKLSICLDVELLIC